MNTQDKEGDAPRGFAEMSAMKRRPQPTLGSKMTPQDTQNTANMLAICETNYTEFAEEWDELPLAERHGMLENIQSISASAAHLACALFNREFGK